MKRWPLIPTILVALAVATMIGLGVGIDYSLLVVSCWREERARSGTSQILAYAHRVLHYRDELFQRGFFPEFYRQEPDELTPLVGGTQVPASAPPPEPVAETLPSGPASQ